MQRGGENYYYHTDELYSVMAVTDDSASAVERYEYQDYGEPEFFDSSGGTIGSSAISNPYLFTGRRYDPETGWYHYRSRYIDPIAGRFVARNKIGIWGGAYNLGNGYSYAGNNPASWEDLQKQIWEEWWLNMLSTIMKTKYDTAKAIIRNVR